MTDRRLRIDHATKRYPRAAEDAISDVTIDVVPGKVCCVIGRNGAGKSTLMSAIAGLTRLSSGDVLLDGSSLAESFELRRRVGFAAQAEALYPLLSGRENLETFGRLGGLTRSALQERISDLAERLSIGSFLDQSVRELSGGERRRVHVAAALMSDVDVVMLDEPTAGVDPVTRSNVLDLVSSLTEAGRMVLYSTHYLHEVEELDGAVVMLEQGRVVASGSVASLLARHGSSFVEMEFATRIDTAHLPWVSNWDDLTLRLSVHQPSEELPRILQRLETDTVHLRSMAVVEPTLDRVFRSLTGLDLQPGEPTS